MGKELSYAGGFYQNKRPHIILIDRVNSQLELSCTSQDVFLRQNPEWLDETRLAPVLRYNSASHILERLRREVPTFQVGLNAFFS